MWYVYILSTIAGKYYTGFTDNIDRRLKEHQSGKGGHYTKYDRPQEILYYEEFKTKDQAEKRERQIKGWSRTKKVALIAGDHEQLRRLSISRD